MTEVTNNLFKRTMRLLIALTLSALLFSCTSVQNSRSEYESFPEISALISSNASFTDIENKVNELVANGKLRNPLFKGREAEISRLIYYSMNSNVPDATTDLAIENPETSEFYIELALRLFPMSQKKIVDELLLDEILTEDEILSAAISAGIDPSWLYPATAANDDPVVTPLINSASVTLFNQTEDTDSVVEYREVNSDTWLRAFPLAWEPTRSALSGSIIKLSPDTNYVVRVTLERQGSPVDEYNLEFKTRPNTPPINPNLVYRLSDIYSGEGTLDLEMLNIQGEEDGWAKIIGDPNTPIIANEQDDYAINIGNNSYVMFEDITVKGGRRHGVYSRGADHLWFKGCDISGWGRKATYYKNGKAYENTNDKQAINYDAGFLLYKSGVVVVENCVVHSPIPNANHWGYGHPAGASAMLVVANHPEKELQGQYIIRNNRFLGTDSHRFNDVIESRSNGRSWGGFARDSAIHGNYLAYANDDIIELDGGQSNVLFYDNEIEQGYCGVSAVPNMIGPSYIFNNYIHNLGDERGTTWAAIKLGGLLSAPGGVVNIFNNYINVKNNGIAHAKFKGDSTYWANIENNIIITEIYNPKGYGFAIIDKENYRKSTIQNNFLYNKKVGGSVVDASSTVENSNDIQWLFNDDFFNFSEEKSRIVIELSTPMLYLNGNNSDKFTIGLLE